MLTGKITCVVVDDEPLARLGLVKYIKSVDQFELIGECRDAHELEELIKNVKPDILFLDIEMPNKSGIAFLEEAENPPLVIITSAYSQYAAKGYELNVVDYLVKPYRLERFEAAISKVVELLEFRSTKRDNIIFVQENRSLIKLNVDDIHYLQAMENYVLVVTAMKKHIVHMTLNDSVALVNDPRFCKVHRSYIVNSSHVVKVKADTVVMAGAEIPLSRNFKKEFVGVFTKGK
jgi:DNA-binding LytR/AlgR family response regulator